MLVVVVVLAIVIDPLSVGFQIVYDDDEVDDEGALLPRLQFGGQPFHRETDHVGIGTGYLFHQ